MDGCVCVYVCAKYVHIYVSVCVCVVLCTDARKSRRCVAGCRATDNYKNTTIAPGTPPTSLVTVLVTAGTSGKTCDGRD